MNLRKLTFALGVMATIAGATTPVLAAPSPSKGMTCPAGFRGSIDGTAFRCVRRVNVLIENVCTNPTFPKLNLRVGRDVCSKNNVTIPATGPLTGLNEGRDFVNSKPDPEARAKAEQRLEQGFLRGQLILPNPIKRPALALPVIPAGDREAIFVNQTILTDDAGDIDDHTRVTFDVFTFAIKVQ
jgi:hypothetical protein